MSLKPCPNYEEHLTAWRNALKPGDRVFVLVSALSAVDRSFGSTIFAQGVVESRTGINVMVRPVPLRDDLPAKRRWPHNLFPDWVVTQILENDWGEVLKSQRTPLEQALAELLSVSTREEFDGWWRIHRHWLPEGLQIGTERGSWYILRDEVEVDRYVNATAMAHALYDMMSETKASPSSEPEREPT